MTEQENKLPALPTPEDVALEQEDLDFLPGDEWQYDDITPYLLDFEEVYKPPRYTLSWQGVKFAPLGGIHNITGQSGNGKTMTIAQFMATILCGEFGQLKYELSEEIPNPRVLYIDTEMEKDNTIAVKNRVLTMAGRDIHQKYDDFVVVMLRDVNEIPVRDKSGQPVVDKQGRIVYVNPAIVRWRATLKAISQFKPTAVFIDGLLDVVADFNDNIECQSLIFKCMKVAVRYDISLWCILHQNPGGDKLVGHLGSFLERKVTDVIQTRKLKDEKTKEITFEVKQKKARSRDFPDWQFKVLPIDGWGRPEQLDAAQAPERMTGDAMPDVERWFREARDKIAWPATRQTIKEVVFAEHQKNKPKQDIDLKMLLNKRILIESNIKQNGYFLLIPNDDAPFEQSTDEAPF